MRSRITWTIIIGISLGCFFNTTLLSAEEGALTPEFVKHLRGTVKMNATTRALQNALTKNSPRDLVLNRRIIQTHDNIFSHKIKAKAITNQRSSGRCWMFAALNILRPTIIEKKNLKDFEFSESYLAFWDKVEKANTFLEGMIELRDREPFDRELDFLLEMPLGDGGYWDWFTVLVKKYGVVPKKVMPETATSQDTKVINAVLERKLRIDAMTLRKMAAKKKSVAELRKAKKKMLVELYRILVLQYGQPPVKFTYRFVDKDKKIGPAKQYTPQSFYKECVGQELDQYVTLCDDPTQPYQKHYRLRHIRNMVDTPEVHYVNVPVETLKKLALKSVLADEPVWFGADASHDMDREDGIMQVGLFDYEAIYGINLKQSKRDRLLIRGGMANHAMTLVGVDMRGEKPIKWQVENSWGSDRGDKGYWTMYNKWFNEHVYGIIVRKAYVPNDLLKIYKEESVELPPWAPMYGMFR